MIRMDVSYRKQDFEEIREELEADMQKEIYKIADMILAESQSRVPVDRGTLKKSGNVRYGRNYAYIGYNTPYARTVHDGYKEHIRQVRAHNRMLQSGLVISVRAHTRHMMEKSGNPYLDDAVARVLRDLPEDIRSSISIRRIEVEWE